MSYSFLLYQVKETEQTTEERKDMTGLGGRRGTERESKVCRIRGGQDLGKREKQGETVSRRKKDRTKRKLRDRQQEVRKT